MKRNAHIFHHHEGDGENKWNSQCDDKACAHAETDETDGQYDSHGFEERPCESGHRLFHDLRLIRDQMDSNADWKVCSDLLHLRFEMFAKFEQIAVRLHADGEADCLLAIHAK